MVIEALESITHPNMHFKVYVYVLPYPRRQVLVSSASGNEVFLSPHVLEINPAVGAYIIAHEMGHVFQDAYLPTSSNRWDTYKRIRGITDPQKYSSSSSHAYRPAEIFAEDFRALFGGETASFGGRIENPELALPAMVVGLEDFMREIGGKPVALGPRVQASNYPNPFNPDTEIRITVPEDIVSAQGRVSVGIYDVSGALVRELYSDVPDGGRLMLRWDGRNSRGELVASANYFAVVRAGQARATLKLVLLK
jgi:hypothetical protein